MAHQYLITKAIDGVTPTLPQLRDPDNLVYFRREGDGLVLGGYERDPAPWSVARRRPTTSTTSCSPKTGIASRRS